MRQALFTAGMLIATYVGPVITFLTGIMIIIIFYFPLKWYFRKGSRA